MNKIFLGSTLLLTLFASAQVQFPNNSTAGSGKAERVSSYTVGDAGNDRLEIANGTQVDGKFIPTLWSYRDTDNAYSMVLTSSTSNSQDNGSSPLMLFTTNIASSIQLGAPATADFPWGYSGTTSAIVNRPLFQWRNGSSRLMTIIANGNLGLGTISPTALFHTVGSIRFENLPNSTNPTFILGTDSNGNVSEYNTSTFGSPSDADWLKLDGTVPYSINDDIYTNGKVGIDTNKIPSSVGSEDVSSYRLFVKGGILTEEVRVSLATEWADYVFKNDYNLPTLKEVEKQIANRGHLKDVPSAVEVSKNGIELGEMNKILLQKIEELTLYVIDLNKKIEAQEQQIQLLKKNKG